MGSSIESIPLSDRFDRWRFLQRVLDRDVDVGVVSQALLKVLDKSLKREDTDDADDNRTKITPDLRKKITNVIEDSGASLNSFEALDALIPDMDEDEDACKSLWDTVMEIHGRESVKLNESEGTPEWKLACVQSRALLHFDFLYEGI